LEKERKARGSKVDQLRKRVVELAKDVTGKDPFNQGAVTDVDKAMSPVSSVYQSLTEADVNIEVLKAQIQALRKTPTADASRSTSPGPLDLEFANRQDVRDLQGQIASINQQIAEVNRVSRRKIGDSSKSDPLYATLDQQLAKAKGEMAQLQASARDSQSQQ